MQKPNKMTLNKTEANQPHEIYKAIFTQLSEKSESHV